MLLKFGPADRPEDELLCFTSVIPLIFFPMAVWQLILQKGYNPFTSQQSSEWWSAQRHERVFWKEWSNPLLSVIPQKIIFTNLQNRYHWQKMTKKREKAARFVIQKLHSIYIFSIQTSTLYDRPTAWPAFNGSSPSVDAETFAWPHCGPVCMQRPLSLTSI